MRYRVNSPQVIDEIIDGEAVMINLATGTYYSLNDTGSEVWRALDDGASVDEVAESLGARYGRSSSEMRAMVEQLIGELVTEDLMVARAPGDEPDRRDAAAVVAHAARSDFQAPALEKYTDMQDLILLDPVHEVNAKGWPHAPRAANAS